MRSLRRRLLAWLLPPLLIVGLVAAAGAYIFMDRRLNAAYDQDLGDIARALVPYVRVNGPTVTLEVTPGVPHVFQGFAALLDEAGAALDRASAFLRTQFALTQSVRTA